MVKTKINQQTFITTKNNYFSSCCYSESFKQGLNLLEGKRSIAVALLFRYTYLTDEDFKVL